MQIDFHHGVTYILSRLAGFEHQEAKIIAYASQYVDDAKNGGLIKFKSGETFDHIASAHTVVPKTPKEAGEFRDNLDNALNAEAWIPFHFLPGNFGKKAGESQEEPMIRRLVCTPDSPLAYEMRQACISNRTSANALHRLGISTHVYADTWAHQGFVGLKTPFNEIKGLEHSHWTLQKLKEFVESKSVELLSIGHAMVLTFPDEPFLEWAYVDRDGNRVHRKNHVAFMQACERVVAFHREFRGESSSEPLKPVDRLALERGMMEILGTDEEARHKAWLGKLAGNTFSFGALSQSELSDLTYIAKGEGSWKQQALGTTLERDEPGQEFDWTPAFETSNWKHFHDALKEHRSEVLNTLLPKFGLDSSKA